MGVKEFVHRKAEGFGRYNRLRLSLRVERRFFSCTLLGFPKSIEELFGKRNGNGAKLPPLLSVWHRAQVCRVVPKLRLRREP